jgi:hypothetical protein
MYPDRQFQDRWKAIPAGLAKKEGWFGQDRPELGMSQRGRRAH